ncbi:hypothetical protein I2F17_09275 [Acinetobacter sp. B10A]|uniref:hypothetical protein n=1 Tax=Acinetobacter baretiae TaxID=2605383 RepID=UPI001B3C6A54|nr:hypothetical protein [Acinetobacter baretiae]MBF7686007.1 hypothetical protein [Acinetobacter baretiae]
MSKLRPIFVLPELKENQEWACEHGCTVHRTRLHRHVYSQQWDKQGNLVKELAETYYTCQRGHLLAVWDEKECDLIELDEKYYTDPNQQPTNFIDGFIASGGFDRVMGCKNGE